MRIYDYKIFVTNNRENMIPTVNELKYLDICL